VSVPGASVFTVTPGKYAINQIRPGLKQLFTYIVWKNGKTTDTIGGRELRVKDLPAPRATIGPSIRSVVTASDLLKNNLYVVCPNEDLQVTYRVVSVDVSFLKKGGDDYEGPFHISGSDYGSDPTVHEFLKQAQKGDRILFSQIAAQAPDGRLVHPEAVSYWLE
jgi:hypothetical protein